MNAVESRDNYKKQLEQAASEGGSYSDFLDKSKSAADRIQAITTVHGLPTEDQVNEIAAVITDKDEDAGVRSAALSRAVSYVGKNETWIRDVIDILVDASEPVSLRRDCLSLLQQLKFTSQLFNAMRPEYLDALRSLVDTPNNVLRSEVLEVLSLEKDEYSQRRLFEGLTDPTKALLPEAKTLQLLGNDIHSEYYPEFRNIAQNASDVSIRKQAVRLLASDTSSAELLAGMLRDKNENEDIRQASAAALHALNPASFHAQARELILDTTESDNLRAASITALTHFADPDELQKDTQLTEHIQQMAQHNHVGPLQAAVARYNAAAAK